MSLYGYPRIFIKYMNINMYFWLFKKKLKYLKTYSIINSNKI